MSDQITILLSTLRQLRIKEDELRIKIDEIINEIERTTTTNNHDTTNNNNTKEVTSIQSATVSPRSSNNEEIRNRSPTVIPRSSISPKVNSSNKKFVKGDRVRINNKIKMPIGRNINEGDMLATVTGLGYMIDRVYFTTDNGTSTWRASKYLDYVE